MILRVYARVACKITEIMPFCACCLPRLCDSVCVLMCTITEIMLFDAVLCLLFAKTVPILCVYMCSLLRFC